MVTDNNKTSVRSYDRDESIDLIDLLAQLWRGKIVIAMFVTLALILAGIYLAFAKEKWTSSAIISLPDSGQVSSYTNALTTLYPNNAPRVSEIQQQFFSRLNAALSVRALQLNNQETPEKLTIEQTVKGQPTPLQVSYTSSSAKQAAETLEKYIAELNKSITDEIDTDLNSNINSRLGELKASLQAMENVAKEKQAQREKILTQAQMIAEQSDIIRPQIQESQGLPDDTLFVLGSDALKAMIQHHTTSPLPLSAEFYVLRQNLLAVNALKSQPDSLYTFRYIMKPDIPIRRDSPKRALTLLLAALLGGMIGSGFVLGRNAIADYNRRRTA